VKVLAKLTSEERDGGEKAVWLYEEHVELLVDLKQQLSTGSVHQQGARLRPTTTKSPVCTENLVGVDLMRRIA